jgi:hypothetical protein
MIDSGPRPQGRGLVVLPLCGGAHLLPALTFCKASHQSCLVSKTFHRYRATLLKNY